MRALSAERRTHAQKLLALPSAGSTDRTWAVKGGGGVERGEGKSILQLGEGKAPSFLEQGTGAREFMQLYVCQPLVYESWGVSNSPTIQLPTNASSHVRLGVL